MQSGFLHILDNAERFLAYSGLSREVSCVFWTMQKCFLPYNGPCREVSCIFWTRQMSCIFWTMQRTCIFWTLQIFCIFREGINSKFACPLGRQLCGHALLSLGPKSNIFWPNKIGNKNLVTLSL